MKKTILICIMLMMLAIGAVNAADNITSEEVVSSDVDIANQNEPLQINEDITSVESGKLNCSYTVRVDNDYLKGSRFESDFNIEMYDGEYLNGNLEI